MRRAELPLGAGHGLAASRVEPTRARAGRGLAGFFVPALLVSVGYLDPGNWATDLEGGARFGYRLLWVLLVSNGIAWLLQSLCVRLKVASGLDLASACRHFYSPATAVWLWLLAEIAIIACDMAEVLGSAVALQLLFRIPLLLGALLTIADVLVIFALERAAPGLIERVVAFLLFTVAACLGVELFFAKPAVGELVRGLAPRIDGGSLYLAIGILGATVMPHNLYLQSALTPDPAPGATARERARSVRAGTWSTGAALNAAFFLNAAILVLAAAAFSSRGLAITDLCDAHALLTPLLGTGLGSVLFALGLLCSGQTSTITGTMAGQIVMEGFVQMRWSAALRRVATRSAALIPAVTVLWLVGPSGTLPLLVASQVVLSLQLPFAVVPLLRFTGSPQIAGALSSGAWTRGMAVALTTLLTVANAALLVRTTRQLYGQHPVAGFGLGAVSLLGVIGLAWVGWVPLRTQRDSLPASSPAIVAREAT